MPTNSSPFNLLRHSTEDIAPIENGDVILILRRNGAAQVINAGLDPARRELPMENLTPEERELQAISKKAVALALAATNPKLMQILLDVAAHPDAVDYDRLSDATRH